MAKVRGAGGAQGTAATPCHQKTLSKVQAMKQVSGLLGTRGCPGLMVSKPIKLKVQTEQSGSVITVLVEASAGVVSMQLLQWKL